ncbi:hypothetical protein Egran_03500 [Elaphomyces granulatus]|uniref:Uncharacterized protein n=1 Tax=Elaphomyces granulatus TaxID=519963 RepID=A0A232LY44_9EURO|nr:hypothetical protein Egran_03500 [Elaphomyces granulatus]
MVRTVAHQKQTISSSDFTMHQPAQTSLMDPNSQLATAAYTSAENHLAGLVEAATAAAGQDVSEWAAAAAVAAAAAGHHHLDGYGTDMNLGDDGFGDGSFGNIGSGRQLRASTSVNANGQPSQTGLVSGLSRAVSKKRKREDPLDPALTAYTRPPMSRLFASLELSPENFLQLQAAAKAYMLDDNYPERRECVGQRGKGDTEMVKLRLWNCVRNFLDAEGNGDRFFSEHVVNDGMPPRQYIWPQDQHRVISLVIPLLRRMVTNERQRQYAIETRKGGGVELRKRKQEENVQSVDAAADHPPSDDSTQPLETQQLPSTQITPVLSVAPPVEVQQPAGLEVDELGLLDLVLEGYPTDWNVVSRNYNQYNEDYQLDNLWSISGVSQPDWRGLVAAVDSHYQVVHDGMAYSCAGPCEDANVSRIVSSDALSHLNWRIGGTGNTVAQNEFASSITRDVSRIIRTNLGTGETSSSPQPLPSTCAAPNSVPCQPQFLPQLSHPGFVPLSVASPATATAAITSSITLRINVIQNGKRILPRIDVPADKCPDLDSVKQLITHRFAGQLPEALSPGFDDSTGTWNSSRWRFKVWLSEGLVHVQNDGEWTIAQLSTSAVEWMDGDLRVILDLGNSDEKALS